MSPYVTCGATDVAYLFIIKTKRLEKDSFSRGRHLSFGRHQSRRRRHRGQQPLGADDHHPRPPRRDVPVGSNDAVFDGEAMVERTSNTLVREDING